MGIDGWSVVASFGDRISAQALFGLLESENVPCHLSSNEVVPGLGTEFSVLVPTGLLAKAQRIREQVIVADEALTELALNEDAEFMREALAEGRKALPACLPNPPVGCVLVRADRVIARGFTQPPYQNHAEAMALSQIEGDAADICAYVTLEPCSFQGRTPSCAHALVAAGIERVVIGILDQDPRNNGAGVAVLLRAGVTVKLGVLEADVHRDLDPYLALTANLTDCAES